MDEKTSELRDIFIETTGSDTVTERQEEGRGSLADEGADAGERVRDVIGEMRGRYAFETDLDDEALSHLVRGYFEGRHDAALADELGVTAEDVATARLDVHLVREADHVPEIEFATLRSMVADDTDVETVAETFEVDRETATFAFSVARAEVRSRRANDRFVDEFAELLTDADLSARLARDAREDGLKEATEDMETDVSF